MTPHHMTLRHRVKPNHTSVLRYSYSSYVPVDHGESPAQDERVELTTAILAAWKASELTQTQLQEKTGINQGRLSKMLRGDGAWPTIGNVMRLEEAFGLPKGFLLGAAGLATAAGVAEGESAARVAHRKGTGRS